MGVTDTWNEITDTWSGTQLYWNAILETYQGTGGGMDQADLDGLYKERKKLALREDIIKIFVTIHNEFLTEEQKTILKLANNYPTYQEKFEIKKQESVVLKEYKLKHNEDLQKTISVNNIKLGLNKIENYVSNKLKK